MSLYTDAIPGASSLAGAAVVPQRILPEFPRHRKQNYRRYHRRRRHFPRQLPPQRLGRKTHRCFAGCQVRFLLLYSH